MPTKSWAELILTIRDKHSYCRRLLYELYHQEDEFTERRMYELCFALYARFFDEHLAPPLLVDYFQALAEIFEQHYLLETNPGISKIIKLGLQLQDFAQYSEENYQLTNILLQINNAITLWQNKNHICKYCGHKLNLLTQGINTRKINN